jgi:hypothetical protein
LLPTLPAVVYTITSNTSADGLYINSTLPFTTSTSQPPDGGTDATGTGDGGDTAATETGGGDTAATETGGSVDAAPDGD